MPEPVVVLAMTEPLLAVEEEVEMSEEQYEPKVHMTEQVESHLETLTNFVAGGIAGVGEER